MLTEHLAGKTVRQNNSQSLPAIAGLLCFVSLITALILKTPWPVTPTALKAKVSVMGLGKALMGAYVFPFEVISIVLIAALIGTVVIAKKDGPEGRV
jgi:NADH:ubiquinone oxidoreductase subunit 6 (subunit J)